VWQSHQGGAKRTDDTQNKGYDVRKWEEAFYAGERKRGSVGMTHKAVKGATEKLFRQGEDGIGTQRTRAPGDLAGAGGMSLSLYSSLEETREFKK